MSNYLWEHYKGKYRVLADYDLETNDFPRDEQGNIDKDFNDFYIPGKKGVQIKHAGRDKLGVFIIGNSIAKNILTNVYEKETNKKAPVKMEKLCESALLNNVIEEYTLYDGEALFIFKASNIEDWAKPCKLKTSGAKISPFSVKNLPKSNYEIPEEDEMAYRKILEKLPKDKRVAASRIATSNIKNTFNKKKIKEMKQLGMKLKQYIHYKELWDKLLTELEKETNNA